MSLKALLFGYKRFELHSDLQSAEAIDNLSLQVRPLVGAFASQSVPADEHGLAINPEDHATNTVSSVFRGVVDGDHFSLRRDVTSYLPGPGRWSPGPLSRHYAIIGMSKQLLNSPAFIARQRAMSWYITEGKVRPYGKGCTINSIIRQPLALTVSIPTIPFMMAAYILVKASSVFRDPSAMVLGIFAAIVISVPMTIAIAVSRLCLNSEMGKAKHFLSIVTHGREPIYDHDFAIANAMKAKGRS
jgi:hypothetical protein